MEATVVGAVIGATIQVVLQQLITLPLDRIKDFKKDLENLKSSFDMVHDVLYHADLQHVTDRPLKRWMQNLEDLAFEADNVLDEINYQLLSNLRTKTKNKVRSFFSPSKNPIANRLRLAAQIREINKKLELSNQQATAFGLQARLAAGVRAPNFGSASSSMETDSFAVDPIFIGRQNDVSKIVEMLVTATPAEGVPSVLPIVGMGGLGKTTLARKVFGDQKVLSHFGDNRVWVHVPRHFDGVVLLKSILTSMTTDNVEHGNREAILKKLRNNLGPKRYLLVLDDVWNEERGKWDDFVNSVSGISSAAGNCMIVTTRSAEVASIVGTLDVHALEGLSTENCWSIIKAKALQAGDNALDHEFEAVGINIAKACKGLPLAANVVGGLLRDKLIDEWISFEKNWLSNFGDGNPISKILKSSFDNLSLPSLKKCFAYCSIFPKGYLIEKEILIELWMAEGFLLQPDQGKNNMETIGSKFFYILLQKSLLQVAARDIYGYVTYCNMHDFVHDLACSVLCENNNATDGVFQSRYIGNYSRGHTESSIPKECARYLRTLFFNGNVSDITFSNFKSIRTLILSCKEIRTLPPSVRELIHLRYLDTSEAMIAYFPDTFGELYNLETLRAQSNYLEKLPDSLKYLISLRHLHLYDNTALPPQIGRLSSLQTLQHFHVRQEKGYGISELGRLKNLKGKLEIHNLEKVHGKDEAMSADLFGKKDIDELSFKWNATNGELGEANDECVLEGLQPHPNLKSLIINGFKGIRFPSWTLKMEVRDDGGLTNLIEIKLEDCMQVEELPMLGLLPRLKSLELSMLENVRSIGSAFYGGINKSSGDTIVVFPALERLVLRKMTNLREWAEVEFLSSEVVVFPRLEHLCVEGCRQLVSAPSHFPCLKELEIYDMDSGVPLENILLCGSNNKLRSLTHLEISGIKGLECLPDGVFANNHNLLWLRISECLNLRGLPDGLHTLSSLESVIIEECPNLKSIAAKRDESQNKKCFFSTSLLQNITIRNCKGLIHLPIEMVESCAPSLESLCLHGLNSVTNIPMVIGCLHKMARLRELTIKEVPKFSRIEIGSLSSRLEILQMGPWTSDDNNVSSFNEVVDAILQTSRVSLRHLTSDDNNVSSFNEVVDAILQTSRVSLGWLSLIGMSHWDCLPDQIQHLTSLSYLQLNDYGMEALPEWFGNLESLEVLDLNNCTKLRHLPSKEAMQLTKLTDLYIRTCPLLFKERRSNDYYERPQMVDSEWHKISHIPNIHSDFPFHQINLSDVRCY